MVANIFKFLFFALYVVAMPLCAKERHTSIKSIHEKLSSSQSTTPLSQSKPLIILDAGHGGSDEGTRVHSFQEKRLSLITALMTKKYLDTMGYQVILTRSRDVFLSLPRRVEIANQKEGDLFVSIHYNSSPNKTAQGIEVFFCNSKGKKRVQSSKRLANCVLYQMVDQTQAHSRGVKEGNFHVIRETEMPAILVEGGFVTNAEERIRLRNREYLSQLAKGVAQGIDKYFNGSR